MKGFKESTTTSMVNVVKKNDNNLYNRNKNQQYLKSTAGSNESFYQKDGMKSKREQYTNSDRSYKRRMNSPDPRTGRYFICYKCRQPGHIARNCSASKQINQFVGEYDPHQELDEDDLRYQVGGNSIKHLKLVDDDVVDPLYMEVEVGEKLLNFEIDTGACATCIDIRIYEKYFQISNFIQ